MIDGYSQLCPECGDPYIGGPGCYAGACAAEPEDDDGSRPVTAPNPADAVRVIVVVNWRRGRVHGITCDQELAQRWARQLVARYGDPLAASLTVDLVYPPTGRCTAPVGAHQHSESCRVPVPTTKETPDA